MLRPMASVSMIASKELNNTHIYQCKIRGKDTNKYSHHQENYPKRVI